ncbi:hypothetical protein ABFS82_09G019900 [Erythranthe guttata]|uniref:uncharacterized protein LOC105974905 n=1 Tax=Erythranthe guttata TaxID=4155 RepID=UPI00064DEF89|nr:PREDICTED: uncharacterized protein LOC105974905 [Erythranthe guttata]|eukprot:XP_012855518.1 PREDICTED: uncharacterized protein LOC105974905 [Erythranthe guttata]
MESYSCYQNCSLYELQDLCKQEEPSLTQEKLDEPMPWIGLYVAAASAVCALAMAADAFRGFRSRRFWLPCKYFSLNAFSLTLLAVAMKLPVDLTSMALGFRDNTARVSSLVLMSTAMANFTTSLGSMTNNEIVLNLAALVILVITVFANVCIHNVQLDYLYTVDRFSVVETVSTAVMLLFLLMLCFSSVMIPSAKRSIQSSYHDMHVKISNDNNHRLVEWGNFSVDEVRVAVTRYWVMAETGSSQFVIARSAACVAPGSMCLLMGVTLLSTPLSEINYFRRAGLGLISSNYKWSLNCILVVQFIGVALGAIAPLMRWLVAAQIKSSNIGTRSFKDEFKVETYWTQKLVYWQQRPVRLQIRSHVLRKLVHNAKRLLINVCIRVQTVNVRVSKLVLLVSAAFLKRFLSCFHRIKTCCYNSNDESRTGTELDYSGYVLLLEGESGLPQKTLKNICNEADKLIQKGRKMQPKNLKQLVMKSENFNGVREFDNNEVPRLEYSSQEPPNCWSLPVVTLTSVAVSLPNIADDHKLNQLLNAVSEGLYFVMLIEKSLDKNGDLTSIRRAADIVWAGVEFSKKWLDIDLQNASLGDGSHKETLQNLSDVADTIVTDFTTETNLDPLKWPVKVIAARSMYRVTQTILLAHKDDHSLTDEELFERLSVMISDIFAACLTNLVSVIILKCHSNAIEEREESVGQAAILLGESEEILEILEKRELPRLDPKKAGDIEEWREFMELNPPATASASSNNGTANPHSNAEQVSVETQG